MSRPFSQSGPLRIGLFTHSTNPRGGVVHVLELGEALADLGHEIVVHAPDAPGAGFFRPVRTGQALIPAKRVSGDLGALVRQRVKEYTAYLRPRGREFDIYHAHDGISGSALADLSDEGLIPGFVRTVHHLDDFADPCLREAQDRSILAASRCLCVSELWRRRLLERYGITASVVPNGVNAMRFHPSDSPAEALSAWEAPRFLAVGGIERRKNTVNILRAFLLARKAIGVGTLLIVGGATLLDHSAYRHAFDEVLGDADDGAVRSVIETGPLDDGAMVAAYRGADALVFPSLVEGFGLAVLEAMACGTPVITSNLPPFTEYLTENDCLLVDPHDVPAIAAAMRRVVGRAMHDRLRGAGFRVSARFPWSVAATAHVVAYLEPTPVCGE